MKSKMLKIFLNPLQFLEVDEPWHTILQNPPTVESILNFLCTPGLPCDTESLITRYKEISKERVRLFAAPAEDRILNKLVWPLRHAKTCYMVGNYLGTIALCGMVAEMVAILIFEISEFKFQNHIMTIDDQKATFGSAFEKLGQERRVKILSAYGVIDCQIKEAFDLIREKRRKYLHLWSQDQNEIPQAAIEVFDACVLIVVKTIGQEVTNGKIKLNPAILKYLEQHEIFLENEGTEESASES